MPRKEVASAERVQLIETLKKLAGALALSLRRDRPRKEREALSKGLAIGVEKLRSVEPVIDISSSADNGAFPQSYAKNCTDSIVIAPGNSEYLSPLLPRSRTIMWHHPWQRCRTRERESCCAQ